MARKSQLQQWLESGGSTEEFKKRWDAGGESRESLVAEIGYANEGAAYNAARNAGILPGGPVSTGSNGDGERKQRGPKGTLPVKVALAVCKALGIDTDDFETIDYTLYCQALGEQGDAWRDFLFTRLGGIESDAGKAFKAWTDYHVHLELEEQRRIAREADPAYKVKVQLDGAKREISALKATLESAQTRVAELEAELRIASIGSRRSTGGDLTKEMKRILVQRTHPDKMNGNDPEMYNSLCAWINALETSD